jgi:uncharacterized protein (DUF427 family)
MTNIIEEVRLPAEMTRASRIREGFWAEPTARRVRTYFGGAEIADSTRVLLVWERGTLPSYWFPKEDVDLDRLTAETEPSAEGTVFWTVRAGERVAEKAARSVAGATGERAVLNDRISFYWARMDAWYEEDDEVFVHPRDPYHRVDVLHSSRHVRVEIDGETVAETHRPSLLFETGLPVRYYIPKQDVRLDLLVASDRHTSCPYKGIASYWSVGAGETLANDVVWAYPTPIPECSKIENMLCFFNEKVDLFIDGELQERPKTPWS